MTDERKVQVNPFEPRIDYTPGKIFAIRASKRSDTGKFWRLHIDYNDSQGTRCATSMTVTIDKETPATLENVTANFQVTKHVINTFGEDLTEFNLRKRESAIKRRKIGKKNHKVVATEIVKKFSVVVWYWKLYSTYEELADTARTPRDFDRFESGKEKYHALYKEAYDAFFEYMKPYVLYFIQDSLKEKVDAIKNNKVIRAITEAGADSDSGEPDDADSPQAINSIRVNYSGVADTFIHKEDK